MYATEKNNRVRIGIQDGYLGIRPDFLATRVEKADFSALTPEKADEEENRLNAKATVLLEVASKASNTALDTIAELQAIAGYKEFLSIKKNMAAFSTHNEMVVDETKDGIHQEYGRIANMVYEFDYYIDKQEWHKGNKPYEACWFLSILNPKAAINSCSNKAVIARGIDKRFETAEKAKKYIDGRFRLYSSLFRSEMPPIVKDYESWYTVMGNQPEGLVVYDDISIKALEMR